MKHFKLLSIFIFFCISGTALSQKKNFELSYNISGWYEHEERYSNLSKTSFLNNNIKIAYYLKPFLSFGLSSNYYFNKYYSKTAFILLANGSLYEYYTRKRIELGTGPYVKISFGKNYRLSLSTEYNYSYGINKNIIFEAWHDKRYSGQHNYTIQHFAVQLSIGKKIFNSFTLIMYIIEKLPFYEISSLNLNKSSFQTFIGFGLSYNFNLTNNEI